MQIGILGAGHVGLAVGRRVIGAGHRVKLSSARGAQALTPVAQGIGAEAASVSEAAAADLVLLAVPWPAVAGHARPATRLAGSNPHRRYQPIRHHRSAGAG